MAQFDHPYFENIIEYGEYLDQECWLVSEKYAAEIEKEWTDFFNTKDQSLLYQAGFHTSVVLRSYNNKYFSFDLYRDTTTRIHNIPIRIPRDRVKHWVNIWRFHKRDYIFVDDDWHNHFWAGKLSTFLFVDVIGMQDKLKAQNTTVRGQLSRLSKEVDRISKKYGDNYLFISSADNIIVKANFNAKAIYPYYEPELLLDVFTDLQNAITKTLKCSAYGIFTQGYNFYNQKLFSWNKLTNHINTNCIGAPFADLFNIDRAVRSSPPHEKRSGYFERNFFSSLNILHEFKKAQKEFTFKDGSYYPIDVSLVKSNLNEALKQQK